MCVYKIFAVTILKYYLLKRKDVSVKNVDIFEKEAVQSPVFSSLLQVYTVHKVSDIFRINAFNCPLVLKDSLILFALLTAGKGNRSSGMYPEIFVS